MALILNTPFSLIRTLNDNPFPVPDYFSDPAEMARIYTPQHTPAWADSVAAPDMKRKNVVVIILESFGEEYIDALNDRALGSNSPGYAPFMDSLVAKSARFAYTYDNGNKSIDAMPSILASIPKFGKSFILTSAAMNPVAGLPALLSDKGYATAFFHGARTGSMGFDGFARSVGFGKYYGREDFEARPEFGGGKEFDGYWAIWDEPFFQYYAAKMTEMPQPFMTAIFSATSHHPFQVPAVYEGKFPKGTLPIHQTIGYTDLALRRFFDAASKTDWYRNTLFVITNDHTNQRDYDAYRSEIGVFYGPVLLFDPSGELFSAGERRGVMSQLDVMPTVLGLLSYPDPYSAYGNDMSGAIKGEFAGKEDSDDKGSVDVVEDKNMPGSAVSFINNIYQYVADGYILRFDGERSIGLYAIDDHLLQHNLLPGHGAEARRLENRLKALIQTYMTRNHNGSPY
ncbi:MAG: sulfatase-like hydrolase/transferase [Muribaculaceae bacterium]|nr:sulfatase-like hydrolase/transferase [Muribaculaceae bacterium]